MVLHQCHLQAKHCNDALASTKLQEPVFGKQMKNGTDGSTEVINAASIYYLHQAVATGHNEHFRVTSFLVPVVHSHLT